jgi:hypothetical protein
MVEAGESRKGAGTSEQVAAVHEAADAEAAAAEAVAAEAAAAEAAAAEKAAAAAKEERDLRLITALFKKFFIPVLGGITVIWAVLAIGGYLLSQSEAQWKLLYLIGLTETADEIRYGKAPGDPEGAVDHKSVINWVLSCTGASVLEVLPGYARRIYTSSPRLIAAGTPSETMPEGVRIPHRYERAFLELSNTLVAQRTLLSQRVRSAYSFWQWCALITIFLGMLTTVAVSLSATEWGKGEGGRQTALRLIAILLPILGTGFAAIVAFYSPQAEWSQAARTSSSISQLHGQMALGVWKLKCSAPDVVNNDAQAQIEEWSRRYVDIQVIASAAGQANPGNATSAAPENIRQQPTPTGGQQIGTQISPGSPAPSDSRR